VLGAITTECSRYKKVEAELNRSLQFTEPLLKAIPTPIFFKDAQGRYQGCNPAFSEVMGKTTQELHGKTVHELWPSEHAEVYHQKDLELMQNPTDQVYEFEIKDKNGTIRPVIFYKSAFRDEYGKVAGLVGGFVDITERKRMEEALKEAYDIIKESPAVAFLWKNEEGWPVEFVTENVSVLFGYTTDDFISNRISYIDVVHPEDLERVTKEVSEFSSEEGRDRFTHEPYRIIAKGGSVKWVSDSTFIRRDEQGQITHYQGIVEDFTEAKEIDGTLRESETLFRTLVENSQAGIFLIDQHYRFVYTNEELSNILGFDQEEIEGLDFRDVLDDESREFVADRYVRRQRGEDVPPRYEVGIVRKDGKNRRLEMVATAIRNPDGSVRTMGQVLDITDRKEAESSLRESEERFRELAENIREVFWLFDWKAQQVLYVSPAYEDIWGRSTQDLYNRYEEWGQSIHPDDVPYAEASFNKILETGGGEDREYRIVRPDGTVRWILDRGFAIRGSDNEVKRIAGIAEDITERKRLEEALEASERNYREIFDKADDAIFIHDLDGKILDVNQAIFDMTGMTREEALKCRIQDFSQGDPPYSQEKATKFVEKAFEEGPQQFEWLGRRKNGELFWAEVNLKHALIGGQNRIIAVVRDITERKKAEEELRDVSDKLQALIQTSPIAITLLDLNGNVTLWSPSAESIFGWEADEVLGRPNPVVPEEKRAEFERNLQQILQGDSIPIIEVRRQKKDGTPIDISLSVAPLRNSEGEVYGVAGMMTDITERKRMEEERERLTNILESTSDLVSTSTVDGQLMYMNSAGRKLLDWDLEADLSDKFIPDVHPQWANQIIEKEGLPTAQEQGLWIGETAISGKNGEEIPVSQVIMSHKSPAAKVQYFSTILRDMREQKRMEAVLKTSERNYREIFEKTDDAMFIHSIDGEILDVNQSTCDIFRFAREEALKSKIQDFSQGDSPYSQVEAASFVKKAFEEGPQQFEWLAKRKNGKLFWAEINLKHARIGDQDRIIAAVRDISKRKRSDRELAKHREHLEELVTERTNELEKAQEELLKRERLAVLGQLTATVSHELRNPLGVIRSSSYYLQQKYKEKDEKVKKHMNRIEDQVEICDSIVSDLLEYTRGRHSQMVEGKINPWIEETLDDLPQGEDVQLTKLLAKNLPRIHFDKEKMRRVLVNLMDNALQAIKERKLMEKNDSYRPSIEVSSNAEDGNIKIMIKDNGIGMDEETMKRAFEPLFTTRARGTGVGLANVEKILQEHNGNILLESKHHDGTTAIVTIPANTKE